MSQKETHHIAQELLTRLGAAAGPNEIAARCNVLSGNGG
jgi:hypothetical protein